jgi:integrase
MSRIFRHNWAPGKSAKKWYGEYRDLLRKKRKLALCPDRRASQQALAALEDAITKASAGITVSPQDLPVLARRAFFKTLRSAGHRNALLESSQKPLDAHLDDWHEWLVAKGNTEKHAELVVKRARRVARECGFAAWADIPASRVQTHLAELRKGKSAISIQTSNFYLQAIRQFARWMVRDRRATENPLDHLQGGNVKLDRRHDRRALTWDEVQVLIKTAEMGPVRFGMTGTDRAMLYRFTVETGLRAGELRSLTPASFQLDADPPTVTVDAAYSKHRREDVQPIRPALIAALKSWLESKRTQEHAFKMPDKPARMLRADLDAARRAWIDAARTDEERQRRDQTRFLAYVDQNGRIADFHALRHTFITNLTKGNVNPRVVQSLARHSTITLTMDRYSHIGLGDAAEALEKLPSLPDSAPGPSQSPSATAEKVAVSEPRGGATCLQKTGCDSGCGGVHRLGHR